MSAAQDPSDDLIRVRSDYLGAGSYLVAADNGGADSGVIVNTPYGIQAVGLDGEVKWQLELVERCLGLSRRSDGSILASTPHAFHIVGEDGELRKSNSTRHKLTRAPIPWNDGIVLATRTRIYSLDDSGQTRWRYRIRKSLGDSVRSIYVLDVLPLSQGLVVGAVDFDSGIGRVLVLDNDGNLKWEGELGPLTQLFRVGDKGFVAAFSGFGRFDCSLSDLFGEVQWRLDAGGPGLELSDGHLAMLVGTNEAPSWDDWELRIVSPSGAVLEKATARGRSPFPPVQGADGKLYFAGYFTPIDPAESRIDYTSYVAQPGFEAQTYLIGDRSPPPRNEVFFFRGEPDGKLDLLRHEQDSQSFGPTVAGREHVFFVHNRDLLALKVKS